MKPAPFNYRAPDKLTEALDLLATYGSDAKVLAGGQSLVPAMNFRLNRFALLIDINRIRELEYIRIDGQVLRIGALTRHRDIEMSPLVREHAPLVAEAVRHVAHLPIRTRGTIGGSLSHADPAAEIPAIVLALDGTLVLQSRTGARSVRATEFFQGMFSTALQPNELLVEIQLPVAQPGQRFAFEEVSRRRGDFAIVGVGAMVNLQHGRISQARFAACGVGTGPVRLRAAEQLLEQQVPTAALFARAAAAAAAAVDPQTDIHADAEYRRRLLAGLVERVGMRAAGLSEGAKRD